jgi:murein L,D-transpeptidase YafK
MRGEKVLRSYKVALGLNPQGHKEREGDFRTPEGRYRLTRRNPRSDFFLSIQVSYPTEDDIKRARRNGWDAGGSIMIHGLPNRLKHAPTYYESRDWTDGCIAVTNSDIVEIWLLTADDAPIEILP